MAEYTHFLALLIAGNLDSNRDTIHRLMRPLSADSARHWIPPGRWHITLAMLRGVPLAIPQAKEDALREALCVAMAADTGKSYQLRIRALRVLKGTAGV